MTTVLDAATTECASAGSLACRPAHRLRASSTSTASRSPGTSSVRESTRCSSCRRGRSSTRGSGRRRSRRWPARTASSPTTAAGTAARAVPRRARSTSIASRSATPWPSSTRPEPTRVSPSCTAARRGRGFDSPPSIPTRVRAMVSIAPSLPLSPPLPERVGFPLRDPAERYEDWGKGERPLLGVRGWLRRLSPVLLRPLLPGAAFDEADRGLRRLGSRDRARDARDADGCTGNDAARRPLELLGRVACPVLFVQGTEDEITPPDRGAAMHAALPGSELAVFDGCGHGLNARDPIRFNLLLRDYADRVFGAPPSVLVSPGADALAAGAPRQLTDRPRPRVARRRDRRGAPEAASRARDRVARPGSGHARARGVRRDDPPGFVTARGRICPHRGRLLGSRAAGLPGVA